MADIAREILQVNIEDELRQSYLDYAMSVIVGRALPDVRDGLKPVHRRILYAMNELSNDWNRPYKKSARIVGDVIGKYHPHGETAVYDAIVRMAQPFSMRALLVDGQGNFGSIDGDAPAAMRYTEIRMSRLAHELLADIDRETVDFVPNYDASEREPSVLPTRIPNLLVNGSAGIAVGMATNIPPHNPGEVLAACIAYVDDPDIDIDGLMEHLPGPDFPTGATINGAAGIVEAYHTGRGRIYIRATAHIEEGDGNERDRVVFTEMPYQVNKGRLVEKIAELVRERKIEGIAELRDESDKDGIRLVIEARRDAVPEVLLNQLYRQTQLETVFGINMVALVDGQPRTLNLKRVIRGFIRHRREVVTRRTIYDLGRARARAHVLEGLSVALANIDPVIELIRACASPAEAREQLTGRLWEPGAVTAMLERADLTRPEDEENFGLETDGKGVEGYRLSATQAQAILDMRLNRLTGLEQEKIFEEYREIVERIVQLVEILEDPDRLLAVIREELVDMRERFGTDPRRTVIEASFRNFNREDFVTPEEVAVTLSHVGYVKARPLAEYRAQRRGGRGRTATRTRDDDFVDRLFIAHTHTTLLCFSDRGIAYWLKVYDIPQAGAASRGTPIVNLLPLAEGERISAVLPVKDFHQGGYVFMATRQGIVKRTELVAFSRPRSNGIIGLRLGEGDSLADVALTDGERGLMLFSSGGKAIHFAEDDVRVMGRVSRGVRGMRIGKDEQIISLVVADPEQRILLATENGYGKQTPVEDFKVQKRGGKGLIAINTSERNGALVGVELVGDGDEVMLISDGGILVRTAVDGISVLSRNTQGVRVIRLDEGSRLMSIDRVAEGQGDDGANGADEDGEDDESLEVAAEEGGVPVDLDPDAEGEETDSPGEPAGD